MEGKKRKTPCPSSAGYDTDSCKKKPRQGKEEELKEKRNKSLQKNQGHQAKMFSQEGVQEELPSKSVPSNSSSYPLPSFLFRRRRVAKDHRQQRQQSPESSGTSKTEGEVGETRGQVLRTAHVVTSSYHYRSLSSCFETSRYPSPPQQSSTLQRPSTERVSGHGSPRIQFNCPSLFDTSNYYPVSAGYDTSSHNKEGDTLQADKEDKNESLHKYQQSRTSSSDPSSEQTPADYQKTCADYRKTRVDYLKTRADYRKTCADYQKTCADYQKARADYQKTCADYRKTRADYLKTCADYRKTCADYRKSRADYRKTCADYRKTCADYRKTCADYRKTRADYQKTRADYQKTRADYLKTRADYRKTRADYGKTCADYLKTCADYRKTCVDYQKTRADYRKTCADYRKKPAGFQKKLSDYQKKLSAYHKQFLNQQKQNLEITPTVAPPCPQNTPTVLQDPTVCAEGRRVQDAFEFLCMQYENVPVGDSDALVEIDTPVTAVNYSVTNTLPAHSHLLQSPECFRSRRDSSCLPRSRSLPSLSQITSAKNKSLRRAESLPDMLLTNSFEEFTPEMTAEENDETYRFQCSCPGLYQCSVTGLVFHMEGEGDVVYRIVPWNRRLLAQHHKKPAGPLFDIKCLQQSVCQLHLPHCEIRSTGGCDFLSVAHVNDEGIEFISPHKVTETHVIINITGFSAFVTSRMKTHQLTRSERWFCCSTGPR
ncbi:uncharacterized protein LOC125882273 [Epinephelus fuscoguttatus]|uniref:uncharacterized protein LOC125882273 n=1 Tax=Epinephelus fuscoguttatus TaxID=293821 RepID=UPI0020D0E659|nr:uncharacterized protein LOC125882273 [Epinephelus fuscoguttatus]